MIAFRKVVGVETRVAAAIFRAATEAIVTDRDSTPRPPFKAVNEAAESTKLIAAKRERALWRPSVRAGL